jgi:hypothetical protein
MTQIEVTFGQGNDTMSLRWEVLGSPVAQKWLTALGNSIPHGIFENDRIYNFPNQLWTKEKISTDLIACMKKIEECYPGVFSVWPSSTMGLEETNAMHVYFEKLRGSIEQPSIMFVNAPEDIKREIVRYNILIHRYESQIFGNRNVKRPRVVCTFNEENRSPLDDQDYDYFALNYDYGDMMINYPQVGKNFMEMFFDDDDVVTNEGIRPMRYYAAGFKIVFSTLPAQEADSIRNRFFSWFERKENYFNALGFYKEDKKLALGHITVAKMINNGAKKESIESEIGRLGIIDQVNIIV